MRRKTILSGLVAFALCLQGQKLPPDLTAALDSIAPSNLKGDLSFLASDLLQGRYTPSPGLEIAAEFIASRFRAAGLQPGVETSYFQVAQMVDRKMPTAVTLRLGRDPAPVEAGRIQVLSAFSAVHFVNAPVLKIAQRDPGKLNGLNLDGKVVIVPMPNLASASPAKRANLYRKLKAFDKRIASSKALLELVLADTPGHPIPPRLLLAEDAKFAAPPVLRVDSPELAAAFAGQTPFNVSLDMPGPEDQLITPRNVIGVLQGSDPTLKSSCVLVTAHYDHIGTAATSAGLTFSTPTGADKIFNGANDDGSGVVSVLEIAQALTKLHPKRSVVFITFFGEERGLLGSTYYGRHPLFPISKTVADINLEQVGRTDTSQGPEIARASITGFDYSDIPKYLADAGKATGIEIYDDPDGSEQYFTQSDNLALAEQGVPAHTLTTAFEFPDYHGVGDEWQKIDYTNMAKVDRAVALAVLRIANAAQPPEWNQKNPKTEPFREANKKSR